MAASNNDIHTLDYAIKLDRAANIDTKNHDGWTPAHMAGWLNNFDALNLLMENGADITIKNNNNLSVYEEMIRNDNAELPLKLLELHLKIRYIFKCTLKNNIIHGISKS